MTVYTWDSESLIAKMEVLRSGRQYEAVIHAGAGADSAQLPAMREMFASQGFAAVPDEIDGEHVLRVRGLTGEEVAAATLEKNGFVSAAARQTAPSEKQKNTEGFVDRVRRQSFKLSGYVYMIGDAALAVSGMKRGDSNETISGLAYGATSVVAALYGERKPEKVFDELHAKMLTEFARDGVELPSGTALTAKELGKTGGVIQNIEKFLYDHPTQILTAGNAIAGFNLFRAGVNQNNSDKRIAGALVSIGMLVGLLVPEKSRKDAPQTLGDVAANLPTGADSKQIWVQPDMVKPTGVKGILSGARDWVQEKPLRVGGYMAMGNNFFMVKGAMAERSSNPLQREYLTHLKDGNTAEANKLKSALKEQVPAEQYQQLTSLNPADARDSEKLDASLDKLGKADGMWKMNILAAASYLVANGLLSISSTQGAVAEGAKDPNSELYAAAAAIIANQPQELQEQLIGKMSVFLAEQRAIPLSPEELAGKMREKVAAVKDNPWLDSARHEHAADAPALADWAGKEAVREAARVTGQDGLAR